MGTITKVVAVGGVGVLLYAAWDKARREETRRRFAEMQQARATEVPVRQVAL